MSGSNNYEPVAIFWDYDRPTTFPPARLLPYYCGGDAGTLENCSSTSTLPGHAVAAGIRRVASEYGAVTLFKAYLDIAEVSSPRAVGLRSELQCAGVSLTDCPHNGRKDVADKMMLVDMLIYVVDNRPPATIVLITGDRDFAYAVSILRLRGYRVVIIVPPITVHVSLTAQASVVHEWVRDVLGTGAREDAGTPLLSDPATPPPPIDRDMPVLPITPVRTPSAPRRRSQSQVGKVLFSETHKLRNEEAKEDAGSHQQLTQVSRLEITPQSHQSKPATAAGVRPRSTSEASVGGASLLLPADITISMLHPDSPALDSTTFAAVPSRAANSDDVINGSVKEDGGGAIQESPAYSQQPSVKTLHLLNADTATSTGTTDSTAGPSLSQTVVPIQPPSAEPSATTGVELEVKTDDLPPSPTTALPQQLNTEPTTATNIETEVETDRPSPSPNIVSPQPLISNFSTVPSVETAATPDITLSIAAVPTQQQPSAPTVPIRAASLSRSLSGAMSFLNYFHQRGSSKVDGAAPALPPPGETSSESADKPIAPGAPLSDFSTSAAITTCLTASGEMEQPSSMLLSGSSALDVLPSSHPAADADGAADTDGASAAAPVTSPKLLSQQSADYAQYSASGSETTKSTSDTPLTVVPSDVTCASATPAVSALRSPSPIKLGSMGLIPSGSDPCVGKVPTISTPMSCFSLYKQQESQQRRNLKVIPPQFRVLMDCLQHQREAGIIRPFRSIVATEIVQKDRSVYRKADVTSFKAYTTLAMEAGLIEMGGSNGDTWISLHPDWYAVMSAAVNKIPEQFRVLMEVLERMRLNGTEFPAPSTVASEILKCDPCSYEKAGVSKFKTYYNLAVEEGLVMAGNWDDDGWISLHPNWHGKILS